MDGSRSDTEQRCCGDDGALHDGND
jgi:hypothetical protein